MSAYVSVDTRVTPPPTPVVYTLLEDRNGKVLDWKEITYHFRRWGQRNETWIDSNCGISSSFDPFHVPSWFLFSRPTVLSIHMTSFHTFSMFFIHFLVFEHLLEVCSDACIHVDYSRNASLSAPDETFNQPCTCISPVLSYTLLEQKRLSRLIISSGQNDDVTQLVVYYKSQRHGIEIYHRSVTELNLDGSPIISRTHTHPSHSQTSRLLTSSLSLGVPVPRATQCMRGA